MLLPGINTIIFSIIIVTDVVVSSIASTLFFRLTKGASKYAPLYSQFYTTLWFSILTWLVYYFFHFAKRLYPTIFNYHGSSDRKPKCKLIPNRIKRWFIKILIKFCKCPANNFHKFSDKPETELQKIKNDIGDDDGNEIDLSTGKQDVVFSNEVKEDDDDKDKNKNSGLYKCYLLFSLFDTSINALAILPVLYFSSVFIIVVSQISLVLNMVGSRVYFGKQYTTAQILSVSLVFFAVILGCSPELVEYFNLTTNSTISPIMEDESLELLDDSNTTSTNQVHKVHYGILFIIFIFVNILATISSIYKEKIYKKYNLDPIKTVAIIATLQLPFSALSLLLLSIPLPKPAIYVEPHKLGEYFYNGTMLLIDFDSGTNLLCVFIGYILCVIVANIIDFIITQRISSTFNIVNNVSVLTLSILFMGWKPLAGEAYKQVTIFEYGAICLIIIAIINYWNGTPEKEKLFVKMDGRDIISSQAVVREGRGVVHQLNIINTYSSDNDKTYNTNQKIPSDAVLDGFLMFEFVDGEIVFKFPKKLQEADTNNTENDETDSENSVSVSSQTSLKMTYNTGTNTRTQHPTITEGVLLLTENTE